MSTKTTVADDPLRAYLDAPRDLGGRARLEARDRLDMDDLARVQRIGEALDAARAEGRLEGLTMARDLCRKRGQPTGYYRDDREGEADRCADEIGELLNVTP